MSDAERAQKLRELLEDARNLDITIHSDEEAQEYLDSVEAPGIGASDGSARRLRPRVSSDNALRGVRRTSHGDRGQGNR
jgi:hypothetical protein